MARAEQRENKAHNTAKFRAEASLRCKKEHENGILLEEGTCTTPTKIDCIILNKDFDLEVAIIEVSGPNKKVNTTHFLEDRKKTAKNLKYMYNAIMSLKEKPSIEFKMPIKVYGFHVYCKLYKLNAIMTLLLIDYGSKHLVHVQPAANHPQRPVSFPAGVLYSAVPPQGCDLVFARLNFWSMVYSSKWLRVGLLEVVSIVTESNAHFLQDILEEQHKYIHNFVYEEPTPASSIGGSGSDEPYISPRKKKQKVKQN